jgi:hypothetical protein
VTSCWNCTCWTRFTVVAWTDLVTLALRPGGRRKEGYVIATNHQGERVGCRLSQCTVWGSPTCVGCCSMALHRYGTSWRGTNCCESGPFPAAWWWGWWPRVYAGRRYGLATQCAMVLGETWPRNSKEGRLWYFCENLLQVQKGINTSGEMPWLLNINQIK